VYNIILLISA